MTHTTEQLIAIGLDMGLTADCAAEMAVEHIARRDEALPRYVRLDLNACTGKVSARLGKFLDRKFGWNAENLHRILGLYVNRDKAGNWYLVA